MARCFTILQTVYFVLLNQIKGHAYRYELFRLTRMRAAELANYIRALDGVIQDTRCCLVQ